jgi:hypothetical protein
MHIRILALFVLTLLLFVAPSWAQQNCGGEEQISCSISQNFSPGVTTGIYDFTQASDGYLIVQFDTVLTNFTLTVTLDFTTNTVLGPELDPTEFPAGTVCVQYPSQGANNCVQYDLSGSPALPVKNVDYKGLINLTLSYFTAGGFVVQTPAFAHAPGDTTPPAFTVNILDAYSDDTICPLCEDPTMHGKIPTPSSLIALNERLANNGNDLFCSLTLTTTNVASGQKPQVEVTLAEATGACGGAGLRDKTASISVSAQDSNGNFAGFPALKNVEANKFHWDAKSGLNEYDISTDGLADGTYTVTVFSNQIPPQSGLFCMSSGNATIGACP